MSRSIWTPCGGKRNARKLAFDAWRVVESQFITSTRKLVDSDAEQERLEALLEGAKPPVPSTLPTSLHWLLFTPFRHPPLRNGSRFGTRHERGIFYAALDVHTALAEVAYYRLVFLAGSSAKLGVVETEHTAFRVSVKTSLGVDLTAGSFEGHVPRISSASDYSHSQQLGRDLRADGMEVALYRSARDPGKGKNVALFAPAFGKPQPYADWQTWRCTATEAAVEFKRKNVLSREAALSFPRSTFLVKGVLPMPAA